MSPRLLIAAIACPAALTVAGCQHAGVEEVEMAAPQPTASLETIDANALAAKVAAGQVQLIDVRTPEEFAAGHIDGAINMPVDGFDPDAVPEIEGKETVLYCRSGRRSERAATILSEATGETVTHLEGGITAWEAAGEPVTAPEAATEN